MMTRDKILKEKDRVQKRMWKEAGETVSGYMELVHKRAKRIKKSSARKTVAA